MCPGTHSRRARCRQAMVTFRASAHPQRSVFFYTVGNEVSYRIKKPRPCKRTRFARCTTCYIIRPAEEIFPDTGYMLSVNGGWPTGITSVLCLKLSVKMRFHSCNSEGIFSKLYSHRSHTPTGSLPLFKYAYSLRHSFSCI